MIPYAGGGFRRFRTLGEGLEDSVRWGEGLEYFVRWWRV